MTYVSTIILPRVREIRARGLGFDEYARAMSSLADEQFGTLVGGPDSHGAAGVELLELIEGFETRIAALEERVRLLEAQK